MPSRFALIAVPNGGSAGVSAAPRAGKPRPAAHDARRREEYNP
jgi:hypothetical protein